MSKPRVLILSKKVVEGKKPGVKNESKKAVKGQKLNKMEQPYLTLASKTRIISKNLTLII